MSKLHSIISLVISKASKVIIVLVLFMTISPLNAFAEVNVSINNRQVNFEQDPYLDQSAGRVLVPFRQIFESLGADVWYDSKNNSAFGKKDNNLIKLPINKNSAYHNDNKINLDVKTRTINGRTMVPLRFISETLGYTVEAQNMANDMYIRIYAEDLEMGQADIDQELNSYVLNLINTYKIGNYPYILNNDYSNYNGVTTTLAYQDKVLAKAHPSGNNASHCVGITFEVFFKAMQQRNQELGRDIDDFNGLSWNELYDFMLTWYVANGDKSTSNVAKAVEKYDLGKQIHNLEDAKAGDFIDISRENNTGHTAVFIDWIKKNGKIIGFKYWSSQESTNGISYKEEYFNVTNENGKKYGNVMRDKVYIARVN